MGSQNSISSFFEEILLRQFLIPCRYALQSTMSCNFPAFVPAYLLPGGVKSQNFLRSRFYCRFPFYYFTPFFGFCREGR